MKGLRHVAREEDGMQRWGWFRNDARHVAQQQVGDPGNRLVSAPPRTCTRCVSTQVLLPRARR